MSKLAKLAKNEKITFMVNTPAGLINALFIAKNALLPAYKISCDNSSAMFGPSPLNELQEVIGLVNSSGGSFSESQLRSISDEYRFYPFYNKASVETHREYMCTPKEANDVRCVAAEIGDILRNRLGENITFDRAVHKYQEWINEFFDYKNTGSINDHTAVGLLKNRTGVCQAIAAVTLLVFPYLGFPVQFVSGDASGGDSWGPHAWNAVKVSNAWIHVDFTFGMKSFYTPNTRSGLEKRFFQTDHRWDETAYSDAALSRSQDVLNRLMESSIELFENKKTFILGDVAVHTETPLMIGNRNDGHWIDVFRLLPLMGGSCEFLPDSNQIRVCLYNHQSIIDGASAYLTGPAGYVNISLIKEFAIILGGSDHAIRFKMR